MCFQTHIDGDGATSLKMWRAARSDACRQGYPGFSRVATAAALSVSFEQVHSRDEGDAGRGRRGALAIAAAFSHPRSSGLAIGDRARSRASRPPFGQLQPHGLDGASDLGVTLLEPRKRIFQNLLGAFGIDCHGWPHARITHLRNHNPELPSLRNHYVDFVPVACGSMLPFTAPPSSTNGSRPRARTVHCS